MHHSEQGSMGVDPYGYMYNIGGFRRAHHQHPSIIRTKTVHHCTTIYIIAIWLLSSRARAKRAGSFTFSIGGFHIFSTFTVLL